MEKINISIIVEQVGKLIEKYSNDEETQKEFCAEVEKRYFPTGKYEKDEYDVDEATIQKWRRQMPKLTRENVKVYFAHYYKESDETVLGLGMMAEDDDNETGYHEKIVRGCAGQVLSELFTVITNKVIAELYSMPEIITLNPVINHGDGDEGGLYFTYKGDVDFES